jgi:hypothetical protein
MGLLLRGSSYEVPGARNKQEPRAAVQSSRERQRTLHGSELTLQALRQDRWNSYATSRTSKDPPCRKQFARQARARGPSPFAPRLESNELQKHMANPSLSSQQARKREIMM